MEQLEVLLLLRQAPTIEWTPEAVASILYGHPVSITHRLAALRAKGMVERCATTDERYRYCPQTEQLGATIERLAATYKERRVAVITVIASKPLENVRAFSEAFRIRKRGE